MTVLTSSFPIGGPASYRLTATTLVSAGGSGGGTGGRGDTGIFQHSLLH